MRFVLGVCAGYLGYGAYTRLAKARRARQMERRGREQQDDSVLVYDEAAVVKTGNPGVSQR